jgi:hypothetical protein
VKRKNKSGIPGVRGKRTEGTLLAVPVERKAPKSDALLRIEAQVQANAQGQHQNNLSRTITQLRRSVK